MPPSVCRIAGCRRHPHARGLCQQHYDQQRKSSADPARAAKPPVKSAAATPEPLAELDGKFCRASGCTNPHHAKGYCKSHYGQIRRHGHVEDLPGETGEKQPAALSKDRRLLEIVKRHEILKKEIASIHKELEAQVDEE